MVRSFAYLSVGIALTISGSVVSAEGAGQAGPLPGAGDSTSISSGNRNANAEYNRLVGASDPKPAANNDDRRARSAPVPATAADLKVGSPLRDVAGVHIGTISQVDPDGVIVDTGATKIKVPTIAFGRDNQGLLLNLTAARFNELIAKAHAAH